MAIKLMDEIFRPYRNLCVKEFLCDTDEDFAKLPECCVGSTALSIATGNVRIVNTQGKWVAFAE